MESNGKRLIGTLQKKWIIMSMLSDVLLALSFSIIITALIQKASPRYLWVAGMVFGLALFILGSLHNYWKIQSIEVARYLNNRVPRFEESVQLLLKPAASLNLLESLQVNKVEGLIGTSKLPPFHNKRPLWSVLVLFASVIIAGMLTQVPSFTYGLSTRLAGLPAAGLKQQKTAVQQATVSDVELTIYPPAYLVQDHMEQSFLALHAVEGSHVEWRITMNNPVKKLDFVFNDKETIALSAADNSGTKWMLNKTLVTSGFYQLKIQDKLSEMYMIDLLKDQLPVVRILTPKQYTTIDFGAPQQVPLRAALTDDYGIVNASITATIASGSGESVKFREQRLPFTGFTAGSRETALQKTIDLRALGMQPGDELYYYVSAQDNHRQESRSDICIISLPDTAQLMETEGMTNNVSLKQEYFRSQRQIIIETKQLLKDKDTISLTSFNNKSNNLGLDQKLLRMRYGKFLGEESDNEIGVHHDHDEGAKDETVFGDAKKMIEEFTHQHDNAEDATFFDPKLKAQLKATLSEMWKAELQLRLYKPQAALPFEYKALLLLKDLQQQSRVYVAKASYKTTPLRPEKRLTGDLTKIIQPSSEQTVKQDNQTDEVVRKAAGLMEELKLRSRLSPPSRKILQAAALYLGNMAVAKPTVYLTSFKAMKRVLSALDDTTVPVTDINAAEKGLQHMIEVTGKSPRPEQAGTRQRLSQQYFKNLMQTNR